MAEDGASAEPMLRFGGLADDIDPETGEPIHPDLMPTMRLPLNLEDGMDSTRVQFMLDETDEILLPMEDDPEVIEIRRRIPGARDISAPDLKLLKEMTAHPPKKQHPGMIGARVPVHQNADGSVVVDENNPAAKTIGNVCVAPILQSFNEVQRETKDYEDKPVIREDIRIPSKFALKNMALMKIVEMVRERHKILRDKKFDTAHQAFHLQCGFPSEVIWTLNVLVEESQHIDQDWGIKEMAGYVGDRYCTPKEFFEKIKPSNFLVYDINEKTMQVTALSYLGEKVFQHNFTDIYRTYLNRPKHDNIEHLLQRHKRLMEDQRSLNDTYDSICRTGMIMARVHTKKRFNTVHHKALKLMLRDMDGLGEMQWSLVCEKDSAYVYLNDPMPEYLSRYGERLWEIGMENLRRLYVQRTWIKRRCLERGGAGKHAKDAIWLYFLEGYDCECLAFIASTMFVKERMQEIANLKVEGDVIMGIIRDDVVMLCGSEELWSIAYMSHGAIDTAGHEAYVGAFLRLDKLPDGTLSWVKYRPRMAKEVVIPRNRVEADLFLCQVDQRVHPTGCAYCHRMVNRLMVCSRCQDNFYCSKDCQKMNWVEHKPYCMKRSSTKGAIPAAEKAKKRSKQTSSEAFHAPMSKEKEAHFERLHNMLPKKYQKYAKSLLD